MIPEKAEYIPFLMEIDITYGATLAQIASPAPTNLHWRCYLLKRLLLLISAYLSLVATEISNDDGSLACHVVVHFERRDVTWIAWIGDDHLGAQLEACGRLWHKVVSVRFN